MEDFNSFSIKLKVRDATNTLHIKFIYSVLPHIRTKLELFSMSPHWIMPSNQLPKSKPRLIKPPFVLPQR